MSGRFCDKHQEWCPAGECRWCEPPKATAPQATATPGPETGLYPHLLHETYPERRERNGLGPLLDGAGFVTAAEIANDALVELGRPEKLDIERTDVYGNSPAASLLEWDLIPWAWIVGMETGAPGQRGRFVAAEIHVKGTAPVPPPPATCAHGIPHRLAHSLFGKFGQVFRGAGATITIRDCDSCPECLKERIKVLSVALGQAIGSASVLAFSKPSPSAREAAIAQLEAASDTHLKDQRDHLA